VTLDEIARALPPQYRLEREVGAGGMATVYAARDVRHDRLVAVKVLRPDVCPATGAARFLREIRIAAQLTHPHILPLIDSGDASGLLFYVLPYIDGETLRQRLSRTGAMPPHEVVTVIRHVLEALDYAHAHGVVHRDIKPENVLVSDRHALVMDFGIARAIGGPDTETAVGTLLTAVGTAIGTPAYMAPEQVAGGVVDHRADLYAVGVLAYEMLTGQLPFTAPTPHEMMAAHVTAAPAPLLQRAPSAPPRLAAVVMRCLEKRPEDRWQRAGELLEALASSSAEPPRPARAAPNPLVEGRFTLSERVCRKLNRATLDPRVIGDHLSYVDNHVPSDVLVFFLHGLGLDHRDFEPILERLAYRGLSPTLYGGEPDRRTRIPLSLRDHVVILREWLRDAVDRLRPSTVIMVGFSLGADMGFELVLGPTDDPTPPIDGFLSLECNLSLETCFVSSLLASVPRDRPELLLPELQRLGNSAATIESWLNVQEYLVKVLRKFHGNVGVLQRAAADIVEPLAAEPGFGTFARWFKGARARIPALRLIFPGAPGSLIPRLRLENLDTGLLGEEFPEEIISVLPNSDHFSLMATDYVLGEIDMLLKRLNR